MPYNGSGSYSAPANSWNPAVGGTTVDSADWNTTQTDYETAFSNVICKDGQTTITANLPMAGFKHTGVNPASGSTSRTEYLAGGAAQDGASLDAGYTSGTATAYTATLAPAITAYADKQLFRVVLDNATGATPTINFNSVGAKKIYKNVAGTATQLAANDLPDNFVTFLRYDETLDSAAGGFWVANFPSPVEQLGYGTANYGLVTSGSAISWGTIVRPAVSTNLTVGYTATAYDNGTVTSGTLTPDPANGNLQRYVSNGAHTLAPPSATGDYTIVIQSTNGASAGTVTTSGFTKVTGDSLTTTNGDDFMLYITKLNSFTLLNIVALQ